MPPTKYIKYLAKKIVNNYKCRKPCYENDEFMYYDYGTKHIDLDGVFESLEMHEYLSQLETPSFNLMKAQHLLAVLFGYRSWTELIKQSSKQHEVIVLIFNNHMNVEEWLSEYGELPVEIQLEIANGHVESGNSIFHHFNTFKTNESS